MVTTWNNLFNTVKKTEQAAYKEQCSAGQFSATHITFTSSSVDHNKLNCGGGNSNSSLRLNTAKYLFPPNLATLIPSSVFSSMAFTAGSSARHSASGIRSKYGCAVHFATCHLCSSSTSVVHDNL